MTSPRRITARVANAGLVVFGLGLVVVLGTGGTRIDLGFVSVGLREIAAPLTFFCFFAALRLVASSRSSGLEARLVTFLARQGLPPRDAPATVASSVRAGTLLGFGMGLVVACADVVRLVLATPAPGPLPHELMALAGMAFAIGELGGGLAGAVAGLLAWTGARLSGQRLGRYQAGRWTVALLVIAAPGMAWLAPPVGSDEHTPAVLLGVAASVVPALALAFLAIPAAVLRARRGRWGLAVASATVLALVLGCAAVVALGPAGLYGPARESAYPNVLLVSISGLRPEFIRAYGGPGQSTPALASLAIRGALFREAFTPSTDIAAGAASMLTGLYPATHGLRGPGDQLRPGIDGLPLVLAGHGFRTAAFVSTRPLGGRETGLAQLFERYDDPTSLVDWLGRMALGRPLVRPASRLPRVTRPAETTVAAFREWVSAVPRGPWFAWVQFADLLRPHPDLGDVPRAAQGPPLPHPPEWASRDEQAAPLQAWRRGFERALLSIDAQVGALEEIVARRGELHRTVIVIVAEQGAPLGEDGVWFGHPRGLEQGITNVPWIVFATSIRSRTSVDGPCSLVDVAPTTLGLVGLGGGQTAEGEDLSRYLLAGGALSRDPQRSGPVYSEVAARPYGARSVRLGRWKLLRDARGAEHLFVWDDGVEREVPVAHGREERQRQHLSDELTRRQAQEAEAAGGS